jgi:hypothetical protein
VWQTAFQLKAVSNDVGPNPFNNDATAPRRCHLCAPVARNPGIGHHPSGYPITHHVNYDPSLIGNKTITLGTGGPLDSEANRSGAVSICSLSSQDGQDSQRSSQSRESGPQSDA